MESQERRSRDFSVSGVVLFCFSLLGLLFLLLLTCLVTLFSFLLWGDETGMGWEDNGETRKGMELD